MRKQLLALWIASLLAAPGFSQQRDPSALRATFSPSALKQETSFEGEPVSLKLVDVSLVDFFRTISELSGLNILIDPDVSGLVTINVEEVPWDQLFEVVLKSHGLRAGIEGSLVRISTRRTLQQEEESEQALKRAAFLAQDTATVTLNLNYAVGEDILRTLERQLTQRGELTVDSRTNTVIITDVPEGVRKISRLIETLDAPEKQVEIEARIVEATTRFARQLGSELGMQFGKITDRVQGSADVAARVADPIGTASLTTGKMLDTVRLDAILTAAEARGEARILSKPRVTAQNNAEAIITQGSKIPIPVQQNFSTSVRFETAALQLTVTPQITEEETVSLNIRVENNIPDFSRTVLGIPTILTSESRTRVLVQDGGTTVIGGIYVEIDRENLNKVPALGDIPVLGHLFKNTTKERETREILFFITPRIRQ
ncbi:MAG TPA: type IV pilus secretin PilQ [Acidobacteriota bacterium]|nr:type IV pilus secretin PilQ [Acidobacteriota bacterium]